MATVEELKDAILGCTEEELATMAIVLNKAICVRLQRREAEHERMMETSISEAWHLAKGSYGTAKDHGILLENLNPVVSDEMKGLAANFLRISELLVEAGFRP